MWLAAVPVRRWMKQPVATIGPCTAVRDAIALMRERGIRHLPVLDGAQRLIGIVTTLDLRQVMFDVALGSVEEHAACLGDLAACEVMTWGVATVPPATDLREAIGVMRERRLGALPVVDAAAHVVGIPAPSPTLPAAPRTPDSRRSSTAMHGRTALRRTDHRGGGAPAEAPVRQPTVSALDNPWISKRSRMANAMHVWRARSNTTLHAWRMQCVH